MRASMAVALLLTAVFAHAQGGPPASPTLLWQRVEARDLTFTVLMPGQPKYEKKPLTAKNGRPVEYVTYTVDLGTAAYMVSTSDYDDRTKISLDGAVEGIISSWEEPRILQRVTTTIHGRTTAVVELYSGSYHVFVRAFAVGKRMYQLGFVEKRELFAQDHVDTFMDSFRLR